MLYNVGLSLRVERDLFHSHPPSTSAIPGQATVRFNDGMTYTIVALGTHKEEVDNYFRKLSPWINDGYDGDDIPKESGSVINISSTEQ